MRINYSEIVLKGLIIIFMCFVSCKEQSKPPVLTTAHVIEITKTQAVSGGTISSDGGSPVNQRGVCWSVNPNPTITDSKTDDGNGTGSFISEVNGLEPSTTYYLRAYAQNSAGISYGNEISFATESEIIQYAGQIIADHSIVDRFDDIPEEYLAEVKKMWVSYAGESHALGCREGMKLLEAADPVYSVSVVESGTPEPYTAANLRFSGATWGDVAHESGWQYSYGEEDWWTNPRGISRTKAGISYCNTNGFDLAAIGFGWCWDMIYGTASSGVDPEYGCHWYGISQGGIDGEISWGIDDEDNSATGNSVNLEDYLRGTQEYIDYCNDNGYSTKVFFTTGPVDRYYTGESGYQGFLKHERIREFVKEDTTRILFDYADILCFDNDGRQTTITWNGHTFESITPANLGSGNIGHISSVGAIRLAKAMWWMLARMAGWDGK